jgi:hypothetical protein
MSDSLETKTMKQLKDLIKTHGMKKQLMGYSKMKKSELLTHMRGSGNNWVEALKKIQTDSEVFSIPKKGTPLYNKVKKSMPKSKKKKLKKGSLHEKLAQEFLPYKGIVDEFTPLETPKSFIDETLPEYLKEIELNTSNPWSHFDDSNFRVGFASEFPNNAIVDMMRDVYDDKTY